MSSSITPQPQRKAWSQEEDLLLQELRQNQNLDWIEVARQIGGRNPSQCAQRWKRIKGFKLRRQWTQEEDLQLKELVQKYGFHWSKISPFLSQRSGKQIREHYLNQLRPDLNTEPWSLEEDEKIVEIYKEVGGRWSVIQKQLKGRSENSIKNRFYSFLRNKYLKIKNPYYVVPEKQEKVEEKYERKKDEQIQTQQHSMSATPAPAPQQSSCAPAMPTFAYPTLPVAPFQGYTAYPSFPGYQGYPGYSGMPFAMFMPFFVYQQPNGVLKQ